MQKPRFGQKQSDMGTLWEFCITITIMIALGFPGKLEILIPGPVHTILLYGPFMLQLALMILASGNTFLDIKLLDLKWKYIPAYMMLVIWFGLSMISTSFPKEQFISCFRFTVTALFSLWIVDKYDLHRILSLTYFAGLGILFFTTFFLVLYPGLSYTFENGARSFSGLHTTKNPCASELSFMLIIHALLYKGYREKRWILPKYYYYSVMLHLFYLLLCKGTSAVFCAVIPLVYLFMFNGKGLFKKRFSLGIVHVGVSVGFLVVAMTVLPLLKPFFDAIGKDVTITGRTPMWEQLINVMTNHHSFNGFGFTMFWKDPEATKLFHEGFRRNTWGNTMNFGAHNTIMEIWLDVGLIGLAAYFLMIIFAMRNPEEMSQPQYDFCAAFIIWQTIGGLTERSYIPANYKTLFLFICVGIGCSPEGREQVPRFFGASPGNEALSHAK